MVSMFAIPVRLLIGDFSIAKINMESNYKIIGEYQIGKDVE
jgi:hypothetical protein